MTELETMRRAKMYLDKLARGFDPLTDQPVSQEDVVSQARISRCLEYVSGVLEQVIRNGGNIGRSDTVKLPFRITPQQLAAYTYPQEPITITDLARRISELVDPNICGKLTFSPITTWLTAQGILAAVSAEDGKNHRLPTESGRKLGIFTAERSGSHGNYTAVLYDRSAQRYILDHLFEILPPGESQG